jgi:hypothetical protein
VTDIAHLALGVRDPARSLAFYRDAVGLEGAVREADFGFVLTTPKGITFSLIRGEPPVGLAYRAAAPVTANQVPAMNLQVTPGVSTVAVTPQASWESSIGSCPRSVNPLSARTPAVAIPVHVAAIHELLTSGGSNCLSGHMLLLVDICA